MSIDELNEELERLEKKKGGFVRNRNLCVLAAAFLGYNFYNAIQNDSPPIWFFFAMSAMVIGCAIIGLYGHRTIKKIEQSIAVLNTELQEQQACIESTEE